MCVPLLDRILSSPYNVPPSLSLHHVCNQVAFIYLLSPLLNYKLQQDGRPLEYTENSKTYSAPGIKHTDSWKMTGADG